MSRIVLFAVGSPLCVDFEESVFRAGLEVAAGIKNVEGPDYLTEGTTIVSSCQLDDALLRLPYLVPLFTPKHRIAAQREAESLGFDTPASLIDASVILPKHLALEGGATSTPAACWAAIRRSVASRSSIAAPASVITHSSKTSCRLVPAPCSREASQSNGGR